MSIGKRSKKNVAAVREQIFERDHHQCALVGTIWHVLQPCSAGLTVQHRVGRGSGGSALFDAPNHLVAMCAVHNALAESSAEFAKYCQRNGLSVPRWAAAKQSLSPIPVKIQDSWFLLDGLSRFSIPERLADELMVELYGEDN